jgi:tetratricopeptide (TPR) repeat protein
MTAVRTFERAVSLARSSGDTRLRIETALRYEDAIWRPGLSGVQALAYLAEATEVLDEATTAGHTIEDETALRARLAIARLRALALSGQVVKAENEFEATHGLARQAGSATLEASVLNVYLSQVRFLQGLDGTQALVERLAELQPAIEDGDVGLHAVHVRSLHAILAGNFDQTRALAGLMAELQEESHSSFWKFIRVNQEAMEAFYLGDLIAAERLADECLTLADELPEEDGSGTYGLRMFMIRREQDRLVSMAPLVRQVLSAGDVGGIWTPGLALLLVETGSAHEAADLVSEIKAKSFELPLDAMWSTVMTFLIETMVQLGDREACAILRTQFDRLAGTNVTTGSGLLSFGRADRYLGMLSLTMGELDAAEKHLGSALEADSLGGSVLWSNESRLWLSRARRAQGHAPEADAMLAVVAQQAHDAGLARLERLATSELR